MIGSTDRTGKGRGARRSQLLPVFALAMTSLVALAACDAHGPHNLHYVAMNSPVKRHPIEVAPVRKHLDIPITGHPEGLDAATRLSVLRFVRGYKQADAARMLLAAPAKSGRSVRQVQDILYREGLAYGAVRVVGHPPHEHPYPFIRLAYESLQAIPSECGDWSEDITRNPQAIPYPNFGCATQRNLAKMVAYPSDLLFPAAETPRSSERRTVASKKYIDGADTKANQGADTKAGRTSNVSP